MVRRTLVVSVLGVVLLVSVPAGAGVLTSATWIQTTFGVPMTRTFNQLDAQGGGPSSSFFVALSYPQFTATAFAPETQIDLAQQITQGGPLFITATRGMAGLRTSQGHLPAATATTSTAGGIPGARGTVVQMSAVHVGMGVNQSMFMVGANTIVQMPLSHGGGRQFTGTFLAVGALHRITVDFFAWTPGTVALGGLTSKGMALPNITAAGTWMRTDPHGAGTVTLVAPSKISIDGSLNQRRTASFTSLRLSFDGSSAHDVDGDNVLDLLDVCPGAFDPHQDDADGNRVGDACNDAEDADGDDWADTLDKCPGVADPSQSDIDGNGLGDACNDAEDRDGDDWADALDNCPHGSNASQADADRDLIGDPCDPNPNDPTNRQAVLELTASLAACQAGTSSCSDGVDNDGDGSIDLADADCHATEGISESSCGFGPELALLMPALSWLRRTRRPTAAS